jgi:hypothetical protein
MSSVSAALNSPRFVRLLPWIAGAILAAGIVTFLFVFFRNTSSVAPADKSAGPPVKTTSQRTVPLDRNAQKLAITFIKTAVARKNPTLAYQISGPDIRQGQTLAQWTRDWNDPNVGISVVPYPVDQLKGSPFRVDYSYPNEALLEVALLPRASEKIKPQIFFIGLKRYGTGKNRHWLVNYWGPHNTIALPSQQ